MKCPFRFDALVVLVSGLVKRAGVYVPRTYAEYGPNGLSGGHMRVHAAVALCVNGFEGTVIFSGGAGPALRDRGAPSGAQVFADEFTRLLPSSLRPRIFLEPNSQDTSSNVSYSLPLVASYARVGWLSSEYHLERVRELCRVHAGTWRASQFEYVSAEAVVREYQPGVFDAEIDRAYASELARKRREMEEKGIADLRKGCYHTLWKRAIKYS